MAVRKGKKAKFKFVWTKELIFLIIGILTLVGLAVGLSIPTNQEKIYTAYSAAAAANSTEEATVTPLVEEHYFYGVSLDKLVKVISDANEDEYVFVYYGTDKDANCVSNINAFNTAVDNYNEAIEKSSDSKGAKIDRVYYLNADFVYDEEDKEDNAFETEIDTKEAKLPRSNASVNEVDFFNYPSLWVFCNDELVFNSDDYKNDSGELVTSWQYVTNKWIFAGYSE